MRQYREYIFDLDGTLYRGNEPIPYATETLKELRNRGALIRYITNNSSETINFYQEKLNRLGFEAHSNEIYSSGIGTAKYLTQQKIQTAFIVGMPGLAKTLQTQGIQLTNGTTQAQAVVVGICRTFTYEWLNQAMQQIRNGATFIATNADKTFPLEGGLLTPGAGSIVAAVQACSGVDPYIVGKPNPFLVQLALQESNIEPHDALAVGDRLDTDIESGKQAGCDSHLVLTGVETQTPPGQSASPDLRALLQ
jgi:4-nitrophenyl phosphatase